MTIQQSLYVLFIQNAVIVHRHLIVTLCDINCLSSMKQKVQLFSWKENHGQSYFIE